MSETTMETPGPVTPKKPGVVLFAAIWNFVSVTLWVIGAMLSLAGLIFGNVMGLYDYVSNAVSRFSPTPNFSYGVTFIFGMAFLMCSIFSLCGILLGIGLLKGKKVAWYFQIAMSVFNLFNPVGFPVNTGVNVAILFLFFRHPVRDFFKV